MFKHSCDRGPHAGSKSIADMGPSGAESVNECCLLIVSYRRGVKEGEADVSPSSVMVYIMCIPHSVNAPLCVYPEKKR